MNVEMREFFETATEQDKQQAQAWWNHKLGTIAEELGEQDDELSSSGSSER
jgi:hypothetical protein